jgi:DNA-binding response OmpR family regulator
MSKGRILVVEDDLDISNMLRMYFTGEGYEIEITSFGEAAYSLCLAQSPHLVILDIMLPDTDGFSVFRQLRSDPHTKGIPVIFLTQKDARTDQLTGLNLGASDYITKPFDIRELKVRVKNLLQATGQDAISERVSYKGRLLVVEDNVDIANIVHTFFTDEGYQAEFVATGHDALEVCQRNLYDLILLDVQLPDMDGYAVCQRLRQNIRTTHTPIIFLTQRSERKDRLQGLEAGADDYITKPFDIDELHLRVRNLIQQTTYLPLDLETALPTPRIVEEELNGLSHFSNWMVFLIEVARAEDVTKVGSMLPALPTRFAGRWDDR